MYKFIKPNNIQIISKFPLERVQADLTYFNKNFEFFDIKEKYLLNFVDHFSKYAKSYLLDDKTSNTVLSKFKDFIKVVGSLKLFIPIMVLNLQQKNSFYFVKNKK